MVDSCENGHRWEVVREYTGIEIYPVVSFGVCSNSHPGVQEIEPEKLVASDDWNNLYPTVESLRTDEYVEVRDEWIECRYCDARINGNHIEEVTYE